MKQTGRVAKRAGVGDECEIEELKTQSKELPRLLFLCVSEP